MSKADAVEVGLDMQAVDPGGVRKRVAFDHRLAQLDFTCRKILRSPVAAGQFELPIGALAGGDA